MVEHDERQRSPHAAPTGAATPPRDERSVADLVRELGGESGRLVREEVELAKTELREKVEVYQRNAVRMLIGGVLLLGAVAVLLAAANRGLTALLAEYVSVDVAVWLAPLILAALVATIGWSLVKGAQRAIQREGPVPRQTVETLRQEKEWMKQEAKEVRRG